jgi:hypothetical protein
MNDQDASFATIVERWEVKCGIGILRSPEQRRVLQKTLEAGASS